jgi:selenocysteine lyase/cysteine desulfurase
MAAPTTPPSSEPALFEYIRRSEIGASLPIQSPFGVRPVLYADHTASGRALSFVEDFVRDAVLPCYGNTHTSTSKTGRQSSDFVAEARALARHHTRCTKHDRLLFLGSGATACSNQLVSVLGLAPASGAVREAARALPEADRPVVFVGPHEHHSNLLPWRDSIADVVLIREAPDGCGPDLTHLQAELARHAHRPLRVGAFSAASNVTGALADVDAVTCLCHQHNALAVWDYASAAPHALPDMNPQASHGRAAASVAKDAAFFSMHKLAGGPQAPGVLVFKVRDRGGYRLPPVPLAPPSHSPAFPPLARPYFFEGMFTKPSLFAVQVVQ